MNNELIQELSSLNEVHFSVTASKSFNDFFKKYSTIDTEDLFVQFTNYNNNTLAKAPYQYQNHMDMMAVYAYPAEYILKHPADIDYGWGMKYVRVLKINELGKTKILNLQTLTYSKIKKLLNKIGIWISDEHFSCVRSMYKARYMGTTENIRNAQAFMSYVQTRISDYSTEKLKEFNGANVLHHIIIPGQEQAARFKKMGYYAIQDTAKTRANAVVCPNEPEQIAFLSPYVFDVVEIFESGRKNIDDNRLRAPEAIKRIAMQLIEKLHDRLLIWKMSETEQCVVCVTRNGNVVVVETRGGDADYNVIAAVDIDEFEHGYRKAFDKNSIFIHLFSCYGSPIHNQVHSFVGSDDVQAEDTKIDDALEDMIDDYNKHKKNESHSTVNVVFAYVLTFLFRKDGEHKNIVTFDNPENIDWSVPTYKIIDHISDEAKRLIQENAMNTYEVEVVNSDFNCFLYNENEKYEKYNKKYVGKKGKIFGFVRYHPEVVNVMFYDEIEETVILLNSLKFNRLSEGE